MKFGPPDEDVSKARVTEYLDRVNRSPSDVKACIVRPTRFVPLLQHGSGRGAGARSCGTLASERRPISPPSQRDTRRAEENDYAEQESVSWRRHLR